MAEQSTLGEALVFLDRLGIYDVVLPFLLVFTLVFAILEKTKVLGTDKIGKGTYSKKNLNSIVAFVTAFLVIASTRLVYAINQIMAHVVLVIILLIAFVMLVGVMFGDKEMTLTDYPGWIKFFMVLIFIGIVLIFLNALDFLKYVAYFFVLALEEGWAAAILFVLLMVGMIFYITSSSGSTEKKGDGDDK